MKMQTIRLPSNNALRCRALAQENAALRAAAARWAKARRLALAVNGTIGAVGVGLVVGSGLPAALCLTPWDWPLTLAGAVLAGAACADRPLHPPMARRARLERLAAAILARMQAQAAARMDRHGRPQTNPYMTNVAHPAILTLYTQWKRSIDAGTYAVGDLDRIMFELSLLNDRAVAALEKEYAKELTTNDGLP